MSQYQPRTFRPCLHVCRYVTHNSGASGLRVIFETDRTAFGISTEALTGAMTAEVPGRGALPVFGLTADFSKFDKTNLFTYSTKRRPR